MTTAGIPAIDEARLGAFVGQAVADMGAAISGLLLHIGDRLGLYKAMAGAGPITSSALAQRTGTAERYVREWLGNQAAGGYVIYDPAGGTYELPAEQAMVVADEDSPVFLGGAFEAIASCYADHDVFVDAFRTGAESAGKTTTTGCFPASSGSSVPVTPPTLPANGCPRWTGWSRSCGRGRALPTWGAGSARPRSSWRRRSSARRSRASTCTSRRSRPPARPRRRPA
jgi:hypothetical protein